MTTSNAGRCGGCGHDRHEPDDCTMVIRLPSVHWCPCTLASVTPAPEEDDRG